MGDRSNDLNVLVLDPRPDQLQQTAAILQQEGFSVIACGRLHEAVSAVAGHKVAVAVVDLCPTDAPVEELYKVLAGWSEQIPIIIYTSSKAYDSARMAVNLGALAYLEGPEDLHELARQVHGAFRIYLHRQASLIEKEASQASLRLQMAVRAANVGLWDWDLEGDQVLFCPQWKRQLGYQEDELPNEIQQWYDRIHPQDRQRIVDAVQAFIKAPGPELRMEYRIRHKDGSYRWMLSQAAVLKDSSGRPVRLLGANLDITERKKAEDAVRAALAFSSAVIERAAEGICVMQDTGAPSNPRFVVWNQMMTQITGYSLEQIRDIDWPEALFPKPQPYQHVMELRDKILAGQDLTDEEVELVRKDGQRRTVRLSSTLLEDADGQRHILVMVRDVTESKMQYRKIMNYQRQLKALASQLALTEERLRRELAIHIHDEISQVLAMAKLQLDGLGGDIPGGLDKPLQVVKDAVNQALEKTRSLTSRLSYPALRVLGLAKAIEKWLYEEVGAKAGLETVFVDDHQPKPLDQDVESVLFRSVREVLANVVKHARAKRVAVNLKTRQGALVVAIEDDGAGFDPADVLPNSKGFGILSIQESLARLGGSMQIESRPGAGCRVLLEVPLAKSDIAKART